MNCKPGDLAIIVRDDKPSNLGKLVRVIERDHLCDPGEWRCEALCNLDSEYFYTGMPFAISPGDEVWLFDSCLRPIRGNNDEINSTEKEMEKA